MIYDNIVIGSGISALGCVVGLLESNKKNKTEKEKKSVIVNEYKIIDNEDEEIRE